MNLNFVNFYLVKWFSFSISKAMELLQIVDKKTAQIAEHLEPQEPNIKSRMLIKENALVTFER
jgi:hypothetical protein